MEWEKWDTPTLPISSNFLIPTILTLVKRRNILTIYILNSKTFNINNLQNTIMAHPKTRGITIKRRHKVTVLNKKGEPEEQIRSDYFICRINASIPFDHKNFQSYE